MVCVCFSLITVLSLLAFLPFIEKPLKINFLSLIFTILSNMHPSGVPLGSHLGLFPWNYPRSRSCTIPSPTRLPVTPPSQHPPHPDPREHPPGSCHRRLLLPISELQMGILQHVVISMDFDQHKLFEIYPYCCRDPGFAFFFLIVMFSIFAGIYHSVHSPVSRHMTRFQPWVCGHCSQWGIGLLSPDWRFWATELHLFIFRR